MQHKLAKDLVLDSGGRFYVSDVTLFEFVYALETHYLHSRSEVSYIVATLLGISSINCNEELTALTLELYGEHKSLSYADCYMASSASFMNATPLWTFDKDLAKKARSAELLT
ncbi:MAG: PIN domain-containing protein [Coriobacteriia bacterium]|nr:PIN domain-containing protein [Coriobacteriia bacterium]MCL2537230.1 PIN domain-containing protein [Coriobacteriia bacterium]